MSKLQKLRSGIAQLICQDCGVATITRSVMEDNGRGGLIPGSEKFVKNIACRVITESPVRAGKQWEGGLTVDEYPMVLAYHYSDLKQDDELEWRGKKYIVGAVTRPPLEGGAICTQAPLTEVGNG